MKTERRGKRMKNVIEGERLYITGNIRHELINDRLKVDRWHPGASCSGKNRN